MTCVRACVLGPIPDAWRARQVLLESMSQFSHPEPQHEMMDAKRHNSGKTKTR